VLVLALCLVLFCVYFAGNELVYVLTVSSTPRYQNRAPERRRFVARLWATSFSGAVAAAASVEFLDLGDVRLTVAIEA